jgi:hypothetical protein
MSAREYRRTGLELNARDADRVADWIELDPRLMVAGTMDRVSEGITRWFLRKYITLIEQQAKAERTKAWPTGSAGMPARGLPRGGNRPPAGAELRQIPVRKRDGADRIVDADLRGVEGPQ